MQKRSTSKMHKSEPVLRFFTPSGANATAFCEPSECPLNHASTGWKCFIFRGKFRYRWLSTQSSMFDMLLVTGFADNCMHVRIIIAFIGTQMLVRGAYQYDGKDQRTRIPFVMLIGAADQDAQGGTTLVDQEMNFAARFPSVSRVFACLSASQGGWYAFAVQTLPSPTNPAFARIETYHPAHDPFPSSFFLPGLKALMQDTTRDPKPIFVDRLPLAARPKHIPDPIDHWTMLHPGATATFLAGLFGQLAFEYAPQFSGDLKIINIFRFWFRMALQGVTSKKFVLSLTF